MRVVDTLEMERLAVGTLLASARGDLDAVARLIAPLEREELMGCLAYCARFAVSQAAQDAPALDRFVASLQRYAVVLADRGPAPG